MREVVIVDAVRTPFGALHGAYASWHPVELLASTLRALAARSDAAEATEVVVGCVEQVGALSGGIARAAVLAAGWPVTAGGTTVDRGAVSGMTALAFATALVAAGATPAAVAAGVDAPSVVPPGAAAMGRHPYGRPWEGVAEHHPLVPPGRAADALGVARSRQDAWARTSRARARAAGTDGVVAVGEIAADEVAPAPEDLEALPPMFDADGTVTAGNSAAPADGAAAILVADAEWAAARGVEPLAAVQASVCSAGTDDLLTAAVAAAAAKGDPTGADHFELPETFAALTVALIDALDLGDRTDAVNAGGGALARGEPLATAGLASVVALAHRLRASGAGRGLALGAGVGQGAAIRLRRLDS